MTTQPPAADDGDVIDRLDAGELPRSPEEAAARAPYERLVQRIRDLEDFAPPAGWEQRADDCLAAYRRRRQTRIAIGATAAVGLAAAILLSLCSTRATDPALQVAVSAAPSSRSSGDHMVGDVLHAQVRVDHAYGELRIYLINPLVNRLIVRCPGSESCQLGASSISVDWKLAEPGTYRVVMLSSGSAIPPPAGTIDRDLLEARDAGASSQIETVKVGQ